MGEGSWRRMEKALHQQLGSPVGWLFTGTCNSPGVDTERAGCWIHLVLAFT